VEANEDGTVGGSHQALYDFARHVDRSRYEPVVMFYQDNRFVGPLREAGVEVLLFDKERAEERRIRAHGGRLAFWLDLLPAIARRRRFLRRHHIDAVHINNSPLVGNDDWLPAARSIGIPILANAMGDAIWRRGKLHRWLSRRFDGVLPISDFMTKAVLANGVPRERVTPLHLGVDLPGIRRRVRRTRDDVCAELGLRPGQLLVTMVGNIREWKGQHVLVEALGLLTPAERAQLRIAFVGAVTTAGKAYETQLKEMVARLGVADCVSWLGGRSDVPDLFAASDLAVHCSIRPEPFGLVVIEAMALGTPVAGSNAGGPAEVITPSSGWLYEPGSSAQLSEILRTVVNDREVLRERARGALTRAEGFSVVNTVQRTLQAYDSAFEKRRIF
jgi:glycosyltransferase involved in cell wall biosynthesis